MWNEESCLVKNDEDNLLGNESTLEREKLTALFRILPFSPTSEVTEMIEDIPLETIQQVLQFNDRENPGLGVKADLFHGKKFCRKTIQLDKIMIRAPYQKRAGTSDDVLRKICDGTGNCCSRTWDG